MYETIIRSIVIFLWSFDLLQRGLAPQRIAQSTKVLLNTVDCGMAMLVTYLQFVIHAMTSFYQNSFQFVTSVKTSFSMFPCWGPRPLATPAGHCFGLQSHSAGTTFPQSDNMIAAGRLRVANSNILQSTVLAARFIFRTSLSQPRSE